MRIQVYYDADEDAHVLVVEFGCVLFSQPLFSFEVSVECCKIGSFWIFRCPMSSFLCCVGYDFLGVLSSRSTRISACGIPICSQPLIRFGTHDFINFRKFMGPVPTTEGSVWSPYEFHSLTHSQPTHSLTHPLPHSPTNQGLSP